MNGYIGKQVDLESSDRPRPKSTKLANYTPIPEVDIFIHLLVLLQCLDAKNFEKVQSFILRHQHLSHRSQRPVPSTQTFFNPLCFVLHRLFFFYTFKFLFNVNLEGQQFFHPWFFTKFSSSKFTFIQKCIGRIQYAVDSSAPICICDALSTFIVYIYQLNVQTCHIENIII